MKPPSSEKPSPQQRTDPSVSTAHEEFSPPLIDVATSRSPEEPELELPELEVALELEPLELEPPPDEDERPETPPDDDEVSDDDVEPPDDDELPDDASGKDVASTDEASGLATPLVVSFVVHPEDARAIAHIAALRMLQAFAHTD